MVYLGNTNQYFAYSEMDNDRSGIISLGELLWYSDVDTRIICNDVKKNCVLEVFALKEDGLPLKEIPLDNNDVRVQEFIKMQEMQEMKIKKRRLIMKNLKRSFAYMFIAILAMLFTSCTMKGYYTVDTYNSKGMKLNNYNMTAEGTGIYTVRSASCFSFPGSTVVIKDAKTGEELKSESPYKCSGKESFTIPPFMPLNEINFNNLKYTLAYKGADKTRSIHEYTANNEPIDNWSILLSVHYFNSKLNLQENMEFLNNSAVKPYFIKIVNNQAYTQTIFPVTQKIPYIEANIQKIFSDSKCKGLVTYSYSKKYSAETSIEIIKNENNKILELLEKDTWIPICE